MFSLREREFRSALVLREEELKKISARSQNVSDKDTQTDDLTILMSPQKPPMPKQAASTSKLNAFRNSYDYRDDGDRMRAAATLSTVEPTEQ